MHRSSDICASFKIFHLLDEYFFNRRREVDAGHSCCPICCRRIYRVLFAELQRNDVLSFPEFGNK